MITDQLVEKALNLVEKGGGNYEYFFAQLNSADWIEPLHRRGRFAHPPTAIVEKTSVRFPRWPEGEYLVRVDQWRLAWLTALKSIIDYDQLVQLDKLLAQYGPPHPAFSFGGVQAVGHLSAISLENLKKFSISELVDYLRTWVPPPSNLPEVPSRAGIGQELQAWVSEDPGMFSENISSFQLLELPTYLRSIIDAFTGVLKGEKPFDPYKVAATIAWMLGSTQETATEEYSWDEDPGWSWAHMSSARFLSELFLHPERLDTSRHQEFWPALKLIAQDRSPTNRDEVEYRKNADFGLLALNSTRPAGLEAVVRYARWLKLSAKDLKVNAAGLPKVFELLAAHLDPQVDTSVAVREMYGMQFTLLGWLDQDWWQGQLPRLFPEDGNLRHLDRFAWNSYLRFTRPIAATLPAMRFRYERAINALQANASEVSDELRSLGSHLIQFYEIAHKYPYEAVLCLGIMFEEDRDGWAIHGWSDSPRTIIEESLKGDERSRAEADRVINLLVARGHRGFRELLGT